MVRILIGICRRSALHFPEFLFLVEWCFRKKKSNKLRYFGGARTLLRRYLGLRISFAFVTLRLCSSSRAKEVEAKILKMEKEEHFGIVAIEVGFLL